METKDLVQALARQASDSGSESSLVALLEAMKKSHLRSKLPAEDAIGILRQRQLAIAAKHDFSVGQVVRWKRGLKNRIVPEDDQPAIVVEKLNTPIFGNEESGSSYFREPLDIVLGILDSDGDFVVFHFDSRRFEPWKSSP